MLVMAKLRCKVRVSAESRPIKGMFSHLYIGELDPSVCRFCTLLLAVLLLGALLWNYRPEVKSVVDGCLYFGRERRVKDITQTCSADRKKHPRNIQCNTCVSLVGCRHTPLL